MFFDGEPVSLKSVCSVVPSFHTLSRSSKCCLHCLVLIAILGWWKTGGTRAMSPVSISMLLLSWYISLQPVSLFAFISTT